jgi:hypothetical protein
MYRDEELLGAGSAEPVLSRRKDDAISGGLHEQLSITQFNGKGSLLDMCR